MSTDTRTTTDANAVTWDSATAGSRTATLHGVGRAFRRATVTAMIVGASGTGERTSPRCAGGPGRRAGGSVRLRDTGRTAGSRPG